jgi:hypothetical protein
LLATLAIEFCLAKSCKTPPWVQRKRVKGLYGYVVDIFKKYDETLRNHLYNEKMNALYTSNLIQNDLLKSINNVMKRTISSKINNQLISVCANETSDIGHNGKMAVVVRFFDH